MRESDRSPQRTIFSVNFRSKWKGWAWLELLKWKFVWKSMKTDCYIFITSTTLEKIYFQNSYCTICLKGCKSTLCVPSQFMCPILPSQFMCPILTLCVCPIEFWCFFLARIFMKKHVFKSVQVRLTRIWHCFFDIRHQYRYMSNFTAKMSL